MGRKRKLSPERINQAIITLCNREGAANLTIDALAKEIGTTKSSIVYGSDKAALLGNFIRSGIVEMGQRIADCEKTHSGAALPPLDAALELARRKSDFDLLAANLAIAVSLGPQAPCRIETKSAIRSHIDGLHDKLGDDPKAMAAMIGVLGLCIGETLGLLDLAPAEREGLLAALAELGNTPPTGTAPPSPTQPEPPVTAKPQATPNSRAKPRAPKKPSATAVFPAATAIQALPAA